MTVQYTTITVTPENAAGLREVRDGNDLTSMDEVFEKVLMEADTRR